MSSHCRRIHTRLMTEALKLLIRLASATVAERRRRAGTRRIGTTGQGADPVRRVRSSSATVKCDRQARPPAQNPVLIRSASYRFDNASCRAFETLHRPPDLSYTAGEITCRTTGCPSCDRHGGSGPGNRCRRLRVETAERVSVCDRVNGTWAGSCPLLHIDRSAVFRVARHCRREADRLQAPAS